MRTPLDFLTRLFNKPKEPFKYKVIACDKNGEMPYFAIGCRGIEYPVCGNCMGEMLSQNCKVTVIEKTS